jgi:hypothetical protein
VAFAAVAGAPAVVTTAPMPQKELQH